MNSAINYTDYMTVVRLFKTLYFLKLNDHYMRTKRGEVSKYIKTYNKEIVDGMH